VTPHPASFVGHPLPRERAGILVAALGVDGILIAALGVDGILIAALGVSVILIRALGAQRKKWI
jgi:hypothetical protein